ncbi:MAG: Holliday junction resolvase RuvX [Alphaproteobacteria bacterium]
MPTGLLKDIARQIPRNVALLGLDVGVKTIGLALSDPAQSIATPLHTIKRTKFTKDILELDGIIREFEIGGYVLGLPVNMGGSEGRRAQSIRDFAQEMNNHPKIFGADPFIAFWDERLSTVSVEEFVDKSVGKRKTKANAKSSGLIDKLAAQVILQGALDFLANQS